MAHPNDNLKRKFLTIKINKEPAKLQLDTASHITILSHKTWKNINCPQLKPTEHAACDVSGRMLKLIGDLCGYSTNHKTNMNVWPNVMP